VLAHAHAGRPVLGICGGYQMLAERIWDDVESRRGQVPGLGLLPISITFGTEKALGRPSGLAYGSLPVSGYEIHHGRVTGRPAGLAPLFTLAGGAAEGSRAGAVSGTHWHGAFENDEFRRAFLTEAAGLAGCRDFAVASDTDYAALRLSALDMLGDAVEQCVDTAALQRLIEQGPPGGLRVLCPTPDARTWHPDGRTS
jgi:adenosylcobyric acid synthase